MTTWCVRGLVAGGLALMALLPEAASAHDYLYCLQGRRWGYPGNCQFRNFQQCRAAASGTDDDCGINPRAAFAWQGRYQNQWHEQDPWQGPRYYRGW
ncbi:DUF3551 domain-containing protein [Bradyrhizobium sp. HKCCYLS1011]|uniref:DUF3551 domain-containing protein n=1 Tax=Bradyrhizobium sp. HKCCYLS1011 TaxID=3420733 RepID=UPI003EBD8AE3